MIAGYDPDLDPAELDFHRRFGPWDAFTPLEARDVFDRTGLEWWVAGGWSIEAFTGLARPHEDIDVSIWRSDVPALIDVLESRYHLWAAGPGLMPLYDDRRELPEESDQVWIREHALAPWRADIVLNRDREGRWLSRRDPDFDAPLLEVTFVKEGVRYLNPEIALSFKAKLSRPKDDRDFEAAAPLMSDHARGFLADFLARKEPSHPWRARL